MVGFTVFMMLMSIMAITVACAFLIPLNSPDDTPDSPLASKQMVQDMIHQYSQPPVKMLIDAVQQELQCCGYDSKEDWLLSSGLVVARLEQELKDVEDMESNNSSTAQKLQDSKEDLLPRSCCISQFRKCQVIEGFSKPCKEAIRENFLKPNNVIGIMSKLLIKQLLQKVS